VNVIHVPTIFDIDGPVDVFPRMTPEQAAAEYARLFGVLPDTVYETTGHSCGWFYACAIPAQDFPDLGLYPENAQIMGTPEGREGSEYGTQQPIHATRHLNSLKRVRVFLGLSIDECARFLGKRSAGSITDWQTGRRIMPRSLVEKLCERIATKLSSEMDRTVGVKVEANSPWRVTAWVQCSRCQSWFQLKRSRDRLCPECKEKQ
jgi:hypothetical protein